MSTKKSSIPIDSEEITINPVVTFKAMGRDLVGVIEPAGKVVVLNETACVILEGIRRRDSISQIVNRLNEGFLFDEHKEKLNLEEEIERIREELIDAGILVKKQPFVIPKLSVRDLKNALKDMDLSRATVSQYE